MDFKAVKIVDVREQLVSLVRELRSKHALSQEELALEIGVSRITIQNIEASKNITIDTLLKVFQYFDVLEKFHAFVKDEIDNASIKSLY